MRYAGSLDVRCVRTCVCNPAAVTAAEELHARKFVHVYVIRQLLRLPRSCMRVAKGTQLQCHDGLQPYA